MPPRFTLFPRYLVPHDSRTILPGEPLQIGKNWKIWSTAKPEIAVTSVFFAAGPRFSPQEGRLLSFLHDESRSCLSLPLAGRASKRKV